jgi:predicted alpha/beta hydrolase family esterase
MAIVFIPGIKGSELDDSYPLDWPTRWSMKDMVIGEVFDSPDDLRLTAGRFDSGNGHWMQPTRIIRYAYSSMLGKLRTWKAPEPVYAFSYDWRKSLELSAKHLSDFIEEVEGRERAMGRKPQISFVAHSMGCLLLRAALGVRNGREPFAGIGRIVFIAPPFRGSIGAPYALVVGEKDGWFGTDEDHRRVARSFPSVYQMTPFYHGAVVDESGGHVDLFDAANWQANVRDGNEFEPSFLAAAEAFLLGRTAVHGASSAAPMLSDAALAAAADKILVLCGAGRPTARSLPVQRANKHNPNWFDFAASPVDMHGDGRIHFLSAAVEGVPFAAYSGSGEHALLCRDERVTNTVSLWLEGKRCLKMMRRGPGDPVKRAARECFESWNGDPTSFDVHIA